MKIICLSTLFVFFCVSEGTEKRQLIGICVEECSEYITDSSILNKLGIQTCPDGMECVSNGCGHVCQPKATKCPGVMCAMFCENGFQKGDDGCPVCKCNDMVVG